MKIADKQERQDRTDEIKDALLNPYAVQGRG